MIKKILPIILLLICTNAYAQQGSTSESFGKDKCLWFEEEDGNPKNVICGKMKVTNGSFTNNGDGSFSLTTGAGGGGTVTNATFVTLSTHGSLSAERVLTQGAGIRLVDTGANGTLTVSASLTALLNAGTNLTLTGTVLNVDNPVVANLTGNASTATALAANGSNCSAGSGAGGVTEAGAAEDCTDYYSTLTELQTAVSNDFHNLGGTDDDVPESGDFAAGVDLEADGSVSANAVALATDTTGDFVNRILAGNGISSTGASTGENIQHTLSVLLKTVGENGVGTTNSVSGLEFESGELTLLQGCGDNQILKWDEATDAWHCEDDTGSGGATAWDDIGDPDADTTIVMAGFETDFTSTLDSNGKYILTMTNTDADTAANTGFIALDHNDGGDSNVIYEHFRQDVDGSPSDVWKLTQTTGTLGVPLVVSPAGDSIFTSVSGTILHIAYTSDKLNLSQQIDAGGATSFELPNSAAPTTNATGEVALDTTITDHQPFLQYYDGGENMTVIAIDTAELPATDNEIVKYDAATDKFVLEADAGGSAGATSFNLPIYSAKLSGAFVVFTPPTADACTQGAQIDAGDGNWRLLFDATTDECSTWQFVIPNNYSSSPLLDVIYSMASATTLEVEYEAAIMCITPGDSADIGTASFSNVAVSSGTVPGTAGHSVLLTVTLTDDSCAAGDIAFVVLSTDANDATSDDATGDREVVGLNFRYTGL